MADDATVPSDLPVASTEDAADEFNIEAYCVTPESLDAWEQARPGMKAFLEHRIREAEADAAAGRLIPAEKVHAEMRALLEAQLTGRSAG